MQLKQQQLIKCKIEKNKKKYIKFYLWNKLKVKISRDLGKFTEKIVVCALKSLFLDLSILYDNDDIVFLFFFNFNLF